MRWVYSLSMVCFCPLWQWFVICSLFLICVYSQSDCCLTCLFGFFFFFFLLVSGCFSLSVAWLWQVLLWGFLSAKKRHNSAWWMTWQTCLPWPLPMPELEVSESRTSVIFFFFFSSNLTNLKYLILLNPFAAVWTYDRRPRTSPVKACIVVQGKRFLSWWSPQAQLHMVGMLGLYFWHKPTELAHSFLFYSSVFMALSTVLFHSINSPNNSPLSHSVLPVLFLPFLLLPYWPFELYISLWKYPSALI